MRTLCFAVVLVSLIACSSRQDAGADDAPPPIYNSGRAEAANVETKLDEWVDEAREGRVVPIKAYIPKGVEGPRPLVILSHGGGGSREGLTYLGTLLAEQGYVVMAVQHVGSDREALRGERPLRLRDRREQLRARLMAMVEDPQKWIDRPRDVSFAIDRILAGALGEDLAIDEERIGVAGHSFGAYTTMAILGLLVDTPAEEDRSFRDPRVRAGLALSPQGHGRFGIDEGAWSEIDAPLMMLTGTRDSGAEAGESWEWRRDGFEEMQASRATAAVYFCVLDDADHMDFSDRREGWLSRLRGGEHDPRYHAWIGELALAFFDAHVMNDRNALAWLESERLETASEGAMQMERAGE